MSSAAKDEVKGPSIRFGIRWDDGRRPKRSLLSLAVVATAAALTAVAAPAQARPMPPALAPVKVVVVSSPSRVDAAERLTERLGGAVGHRLDIVDGFTASVPRRALARLRVSRSVRSLSRDAAMRVSSSGPGSDGDAAARSSEIVRRATGASELDSSLDGAGVDVAVLDSGVVGVTGLQQPGRLYRGPDFSDEGHDPRGSGSASSAAAGPRRPPPSSRASPPG